MGGHTVEEIRSEIRRYWVVGTALFLLTIVTVTARRIVDARPENQPVIDGNGRLSAPGAATNGKTQ